MTLALIVILVLSYFSGSSDMFKKVLNTIRYALTRGTLLWESGVPHRLISLTLCLPGNVMYVNPAQRCRFFDSCLHWLRFVCGGQRISERATPGDTRPQIMTEVVDVEHLGGSAAPSVPATVGEKGNLREDVREFKTKGKVLNMTGGTLNWHECVEWIAFVFFIHFKNWK